MNTQTETILIKSKKRVQEHGEVFTPQWIVDKMIDIPGIKEKTEDIFATFLEPSAGEGAFLLAVENLKLQYVTKNYSKETWNIYALWALSSIYGIEYLDDNLSTARQSMLSLFTDFYESVHNTKISEQSDVYKSAQTIIWANVVQGNTLTHLNKYNEDIIFCQWEQLADTIIKVQRKPFAYSSVNADNEPDLYYMQSSLFDIFEQCEPRAKPLKYKVVDIDKVWKEEFENV